jgi:hypothetical protein
MPVDHNKIGSSGLDITAVFRVRLPCTAALCLLTHVLLRICPERVWRARTCILRAESFARGNSSLAVMRRRQIIGILEPRLSASLHDSICLISRRPFGGGIVEISGDVAAPTPKEVEIVMPMYELHVFQMSAPVAITLFFSNAFLSQLCCYCHGEGIPCVAREYLEGSYLFGSSVDRLRTRFFRVVFAHVLTSHCPFRTRTWSLCNAPEACVWP